MTYEMLAEVQWLMMHFHCGTREFRRLERIESYLIQRIIREE